LATEHFVSLLEKSLFQGSAIPKKLKKHPQQTTPKKSHKAPARSVAAARMGVGCGWMAPGTQQGGGEGGFCQGERFGQKAQGIG